MTAKMTKRIGAAAAGALFLTSGLAGAGMAWAETGTITITPAAGQPSGITYDAYQVFTAKVADGNATEIAWGTGMETPVTAAIEAHAGTWTAADEQANPAHVEGQSKYEGTTAQDALDYITANFPSGTNPIATDGSLPDLIAQEIVDANVAPAAASFTGTATLDEGYALVLSSGNYSSATAPIFQAIENGAPVSVTEKTSVPTLTKEVKEDSVQTQAAVPESYTADADGTYYKKVGADEYITIDEYEALDQQEQAEYDTTTKYTHTAAQAAVDGFGSANDAEYGEACDFRLIGTLPSNYATYDTYSYVFTDTLDNLEIVTAGNDFAASDIHVYIGDTEIHSGFTATYANDTLTVSFADLNACKVNANDQNFVSVSAGDQVKVTYQAKLTTDATIGATGNSNTAHITYSNDPNSNGTGTTGDQTTHTYSYELDVVKLDKNSNAPVPGVTFGLYTDAQCTTPVKVSGTNGAYVVDPDAATSATLTTKNDGTFSIQGLDDGIYYIKELSVPDEFAIIDAAYQITIGSALQNDAYNAAEDANRTFSVSIAQGKANYGSISNISAAAGTGEATLLNDKKSDLPATGQNIALYSMIAGAIFIGGGLIIGLRRSRRNSELDDE